MQKLFLLFLFTFSFSTIFSQVSPAEKEALKALYDATGGPDWISETDADPNNDWDFSGPVTDNWHGIFIVDGRLEIVGLSSNNLVGSIPESIGKLKNLTSLYLGMNNLSGSLPESLGNLQNLQAFYASINNLNGPIPMSFGNLENIRQIQIDYNNLEGPIPENLGEAPNLNLLYLSNNRLTGSIPESLGYHILELLLDNNQLTGSIPESFSRPERRWFALRVNNNNLEGKIPDYFVRGKYHDFRFEKNRFQFGGFEKSFEDYQNNYYRFEYAPQAKLNDIEVLNLSEGLSTSMVTNCSGEQNRYQWFKNDTPLKDSATVSGSLSDKLTLTDLKAGDTGIYHCEVTSDLVSGMIIERNDITLNVLSGSCEVRDRAALMALYNATDGPNWVNKTNWNTSAPLDTWFGVDTDASGCVVTLDMNLTNTPKGGNGLNGVLPDELGFLLDLETLDLAYENLPGPIPETIGNLSDLVTLELTGSGLTGRIPASIGNLNRLQILLLVDNQLSGSLPAEIGDMDALRYLVAHQNQLSGNLPASLGDLTQLEILWLYENQFSGVLPDSLSNLGNLQQLLLSDNSLTGPIPDIWDGLPNMEVLWLGENQLSGEIPASISKMKKLEQLHLHLNQLTGNIPPSLNQLSRLESLYLGDNPLSGNIPSELADISTLRHLTIYRTQVTGELPPELGNLNNLETLWIAFNNHYGQIPESYSNLTNLVQLVLDDNKLTGTIPEGFGRLTKLENFSISDNLLEGSIPDFSRTPMDVLQFENNKFQFGDFENQFDQYSTFTFFYHTPQDKVNEVEILNVDFGDTISLITKVSGSQNHYQWYKDGIAIAEAPDSPNYIIHDAQATDEGIYHCEVTSDIVTDLILIRNDITMNVGCSMPIADTLKDVIACGTYTLPALSDDNHYFTEANGRGTQLHEGATLNKSQTVYIFVGTIGCSDESSFTVTITNPVIVQNLEDVKVCKSYILPPLTDGNYFTEPEGRGMALFSGETLNFSQTVYIYSNYGSCFDESSFIVTIDQSLCEEPINKCSVGFPQFITPNGDGLNELFKVTENPCRRKGLLTIHDRYGRMLFITDTLENGWDGTYERNHLPETDYWYRWFDSDSGEILMGHFSLIR